MIRPLHHVTVSVSNLERSIAFYRDVLGFRQTVTGVVDDHEHEVYLRLRPGTTGRAAVMQAGRSAEGAVELVEWSPGPGQPPLPKHPPKRPGDPGVCVLAFEVTDDDLHSIHARLVEQGVECYSEPMPMHVPGYGDITALVFEDPDGMLIELLTLPSLEEARANRRAWLAEQEAQQTATTSSTPEGATTPS